MRARAGRIIGITAASLIWLAGCETTSGINPFKFAGMSDTTQVDGEPTGSVKTPPQLLGDLPATPELLGKDPNDDVSIGKKYFRQGSYGLAEQRFRKAVELHPKDA